MSWCSSFLKLECARPRLCIMNDLSLFISVSSVSQLSFPEKKTLMEPPRESRTAPGTGQEQRLWGSRADVAQGPQLNSGKPQLSWILLVLGVSLARAMKSP